MGVWLVKSFVICFPPDPWRLSNTQSIKRGPSAGLLFVFL